MTAHGYAIVAAVVSNSADGGETRCPEEFCDFRTLIPSVFDQKPAALTQMRQDMRSNLTQTGKAVSAVGEGGLRLVLQRRQMFVVAADIGRVADDDVEAFVLADGFPPGTLTEIDIGAE